MAIRAQKNILAMVVDYLVKKEEAWGPGVNNREVEAALRREFGEVTQTAWQRKLSYAKATLVRSGKLEARRGVWQLRECPYPCDRCAKGCCFTGYHVDRHRCKKHHP